MKIPVQKNDRCIKQISIENQDQIFAAVLKAGPVVSRLNTEVFAQVFHMMDSNQESLVFTMNLLDFSKLVDQQPSFSEKGLAGWWKLIRNDKEVPRILLQEAVDIDSEVSFKQFVLHANSASFVKNVQINLFHETGMVQEEKS